MFSFPFASVLRKAFLAHIVIYVCDVVNPLKDSHVPIIKKVLRDFGKLDSTIFVINKMDEAGYGMTDESDYKNGSNIKKKTLISRLRSTIDLTSAEEKRLHIICIAADPKGKGLEYWFSKADAYLSRSHINLLRDEVNKVVGCADGDELKQSAVLASIKDAMGQVTSYISDNGGDTEKMLKKCEESCGDLSSDLKSLNRQLLTSQGDLSNSLNNYKADLIADINGASFETFGDIVDRCLGVENDKVTFYVVQSKVNSYMQRASNDANSCVSATAVDFDRELSNQESWLAGAAKKGAGFLRMAKVSREQVFAVRNLLFSSHKFKPWGAVKMASNITKCLVIAGTVISVAIDVYSWYKKHKAEKELNESKKAIVEALRKYFAEVAKTYSDGNAFFENYAPQYMEMKRALEEREGEIRNFQNKVKELSVYKKRVASFLKGGEYVDYQEVN